MKMSCLNQAYESMMMNEKQKYKGKEHKTVFLEFCCGNDRE